MAKRKNNKNNRNNTRVNDKKTVEEIETNSSADWYKILKITLAVICFLGIFFLLTIYVTDKNTEKVDPEATEAPIASSNEILAGSSFAVQSEDYLVAYYDKSDEDLNDELDSAISVYNDSAIYVVDLGSAFNSSFVKEESNPYAESVDELAFSGPTLVKFSGGKIEDFIEGKDDIVDYLS